jgi:hypothetical protein
MIRYPILLVILLAVLTLTSCEKEEGEGGTSTIMGKVFVIDYNAEWTNIRGQYYGAGFDVFIIYGNDSIYSDDFETGIDGWYRFDYLRPGDYKVYVFSRDQDHPSEQIPVIKTVKISEKFETVIVEDFVIFD